MPSSPRSDLPPFLLATPRSGSTTIYGIILAYLAQARGMEGRGELFLGHHPVYDDGNQIATRPVASCSSIMTEAQKREVGEERLALLQKYPGRYFFTVFPSQIPSELIGRLAETHAPIFLERRDLWDQYLSMAVAVASGIWSSKEVSRLPEGKLELRPCAQGLGHEVAAYRELKQKLPSGPTIQYDDFIEHMDCARLFHAIGMREKVELAEIPVPPKQNQGPEWKLGLFKDAAAVRADYRSSLLHELQPLQ